MYVIIQKIKFGFVILISLAASSKGFAQNPITVSKVIHEGKGSYVEANGQPYLMYGIQMRMDNYLDLYGSTAPIFQYFEKASSAGFRDVILPLSWMRFETTDNVFTYAYVDSVLVNAHKYNLRIQLMWFGSNVCAYSELPWYINNDVVNYPKISATPWAPVVYSNPKLIEKEVRAVKSLMNYINIHDTEKRIVMIQVENEPNHKGPLVDYWAGAQEVATKHMLDTLGKVIHASNSNMVTRVNLIGGYYDTTALKAIKGIDLFGSDLYMDDLANYTTYLAKLDYVSQVNHTPENGGHYTNGINLASAAFERGDGYLLYEIRTTGKKWLDMYDLGFFVGTLANDWVQRPFYNDVKTFNEMIYKADKKIARCPKGNIASFNQANSATAVSETKTIGKYSVAYSSSNGGEAIALVDELGDIVLLSHNDNSTFSITTLPSGVVASIGKYDDANQWQETKTTTIVNHSITLMAGEVARIHQEVVTGDAEFEDLTSNLLLFPNPTMEDVTLNLYSDKFANAVIKIYNGLGELLTTESINIVSGQNQIQISVNHLSKGIYLVNVQVDSLKNSRVLVVQK